MGGLSQNSCRTRSRVKQSVSNAKKMEQTGQMDPENCLKCFVSAAKQYSNKKSESTLRTLQKQLDNLFYVKFSLDSFDPRCLLVSDCIIKLIELLNDQNPMSSAFKEKIISLFDNMAKEQPLLLHIVQVVFNLSLSLESFLSGIIEDHESPVFEKSLILLELVSRTAPIELSNGVSDNLLLFLIKNIFVPDSALLIPCLKLLANLCRHCKRVFQRVQSLENYTSFCKNLMSMVEKNSILAVSALSLFTTLMDQDSRGEKLLSPSVIQETIEILFNIFGKECSNEETFTAAVDLFVNLLDNPKVVSRLEKYKHLNTCLTHVLDKLLPKLSERSIIKVVKFFNALNKLESSESITGLVLSHEIKAKNIGLISFAIDKISTRNEDIESSVLALDYLITTFKFLVPPAAAIDLGDLIPLFVTKCATIISEPLEVDKLVTKWRLQLISQIFSALTILLNEPLYREIILKEIELVSCQQLIDIQFVNNLIQPDRLYSVTDWSEAGIDVVVQIIDFSLCLAEHSSECKEFITLILEDWRLTPFLAAYLSSASKEKVQLAFKIIQMGIVSDSISFERLSEVLATNCSKMKQSAVISDSVEPKTADKVVCPISPQKFKQNGQRVDDLIEKMENGLKINDVKSSEIMQMYEYKIESFTMKEKHLHELLDAKATALQQLERILSQYRSRWAQSDAEALNLRRLLQEAEKRSEAAKQQTLVAMMQQQDFKREHEQILEDLQKKTEEIVEERTELSDRLEKAEETISDLNKEIERKDQINKLLQQHIDDHKQNETTLSNKLSDLEKVKKRLSTQLKERETELTENNKASDKMTEKLKEQSDVIKNKENQISEFKNNIQSLELEKSSLQEEIVSLENTNTDLDRQLKENDVKFKEKCEELNRQKYITSLIQNITSGRVDLSLLEGQNNNNVSK